MKRLAIWTLLVICLVVMGGFLLVTYQQADDLVHNPIENRAPVKHQLEDFDLQVQEVVVRNPDGQKLHGYFSAGSNGAYVMLQHGFKTNRSYVFEEAKILQDSGYGILLTGIRAHDLNDGDELTMGVREVEDLDTWYNYLIEAQSVGKGKVGIFGESMGGSIAIEYAALNQDIAVVVAESSFSSLQDTINVSVEYYTGLPAFPFAPIIALWAEIITGIDIEQINATKAAAKLCNTPLFIMQGGQDTVVSVESGQWLYDAACGDKELWFDAALGHVDFVTKKPDEFKRRVVGFFNQSLL